MSIISGALTRRGLIASSIGFAVAPASSSKGGAIDPLDEDIGKLLLLGFSGQTTASPSAQRLAEQLCGGQAAGVFFVKDNIGELDDFTSLVRLFTQSPGTLVAIDHEGGAVQRLREKHGQARLPAAKLVASDLTVEQASALYGEAALGLSKLGVTLNLGPVVDLHDPDSAAIGHWNRAFDADPARVVDYAAAFVEAFSCAHVACALKHFPGEGHVIDDSHDVLPGSDKEWSPEDLTPFAGMIERNRADAIMAGHFKVPSLDPKPFPVALSPAVMTDLLRNKMGFKGVAMTDDLDMAAVRTVASRQEAVVQALASGCDLLMIRNLIDPDPDLPESIVSWVKDAIAAGRLSRDRVTEAAMRMRGLLSRQ